MAYFLNPLLRDLLQKKQDAATPGDIDRLQEEIDALTLALGDKVPKIFDSITEIEIGEIGQKQNGSTAEMTEGGFYKRGTGVPTPQYVYSQALTAYSKCLSSYNHFQCLSLLTSGLLPSTTIQLSSTFYYQIQTNVVVNGNNYSAHFFLFPPELNYHTSFSIPDISLFYHQTGYLYDYVYYAAGTNVGVSPSSLKVPVKQDINGNLFVEIDGVTLLLTASVFRMFGSSSAQSVTQYSDFYWELSTGQYVAALEWRFHNSPQYWLCPVNQNNLMIDCVWDVVPPELRMWQQVTTQFDAYTMSYVDEPSIICILDPTKVATATQGGYADSALQIITASGSNYLSLTASPKSGNAGAKTQSLSGELTVQPLATADDDHKGLAESSDVRNYLNIIAATSEAYGVMWDSANPSPSLYRIGNMQNHALLPVQSQMKGGVMADDGTFTPFDNQADWTQATQARDGSNGQVMVRLPKHWRRCSTFGTYNIVMLSPVKIPGYVEVREQYVSAYEASLQRSTLKLASVNNATADYRGGENEASWDGTYKSLLNHPVTNLSLSEFRTYARNRGNGTKWNCMTYEAVRTIFWLFVTEYATLNSQAEYTSELDANGYHQGGLGIGVTDWDGTAWNYYNEYAPLIPCGVLDEYGSGTAVKNYSIYNADTTLAHTFQCNKYRGIEMPFGNIWKYVDGVLINVESGDGVSTAYMTVDPANFSITSVANYNAICNTNRVDSYIKGIIFNPDGDIFATQNGANSTSYYCDQYWGANLPSTTALRAWRFGGTASFGACCGLACAYSNDVPGRRARHIGSRLCFVP